MRMGYRVRREVRVSGLSVDMIVERDGLKSPVEIKMRTTALSLREISEIIVRLSVLGHDGGYVAPIICVIGSVSPAARDYAKEHAGIRVWDFDELRDRARPYDDLYERLGNIRQSAGPNPKEKRARGEEDVKEASVLIDKLVSHESHGGLSAQEYERLCLEVIAFLFDPHLYGFEKQSETSDGANRYDFICRIKPGDPFWDAVRMDFKTRSILFECKNYSDPITADQIYSTERYLFSRALRTVCFLISRLNSSDGAKRAAQGAMRESGKLILLVCNADLVRMLKVKAQNESPTTILDEMIWDFIIRLPR
ncbi:hypothetical protein I8G32_02351 [Rhodopseudomonas palustris]|nr:hypothetical protein I8G32_02351 [Rhodopseudomonas palustris]WND53836.1 restriction endonuclease [Rhodopseudomonas palustris]